MLIAKLYVHPWSTWFGLSGLTSTRAVERYIGVWRYEKNAAAPTVRTMTKNSAHFRRATTER